MLTPKTFLGFSFRARRFLFVFLVQRALISAPGEKKNQKIQENAYLWTSSRGKVLSSTVAEKETDCSTENNSIMETDREGKFVSSSKLFLAVHHTSTESQSRLNCLVCRLFWSTGVAEGLIMVDSGTSLRAERFFGIVFWALWKCWPWQRRRSWMSYHRSITLLRRVSFTMSVSSRSLVWRERESILEKAVEAICSSGQPFSFYFAALRDGGLLEMSCFSSKVSSMLPLASASWPLHFAFRLWSTVFIFWRFVCFSVLPHWFFKKKLDEKRKKQTSCN